MFVQDAEHPRRNIQLRGCVPSSLAPHHAPVHLAAIQLFKLSLMSLPVQPMSSRKTVSSTLHKVSAPAHSIEFKKKKRDFLSRQIAGLRGRAERDVSAVPRVNPPKDTARHRERTRLSSPVKTQAQVDANKSASIPCDRAEYVPSFFFLNCPFNYPHVLFFALPILLS